MGFFYSVKQNVCNGEVTAVPRVDCKCILFYTMMWMPRALWLVVAHDPWEYRDMGDITRNLFSLFCSRRAVLKLFVRLFWNYASERLKEKNLRGAIYKEDKWEQRKQKEFLRTWECLQSARNLHDSCHHVSSATRDSQFWKMFSRLSCFK